MAKSLSNKSSKSNKRELIIPCFSFIGNIASGKSTYADHLASEIEKAFGITVYRPSTSKVLSEIGEYLFDMKGKDRRLLQQISAKMKEIDPAVLANYLIRDIKENQKIPFVEDGMRNLDEAKAFKKNFNNFIIIKIEAEQSERQKAHKEKYGRYLTPEELETITEKTIEGIRPDIILKNNYSKRDLERQVGDIIESIRNGKI